MPRGINDGAAFFVLADAAVAAAAGHKPMARLASYAIAGVPNDVMGEGPIPATKLALKKGGFTLDQMDVIESNEAFAAQAIAVARGLEFDMKQGQPQRRRHRPGPPHRLQRRLPGHQGGVRTAPHRRPLCAGDDVHRRRPGHRRGVRAAVTLRARPPGRACPGMQNAARRGRVSRWRPRFSASAGRRAMPQGGRRRNRRRRH